MIAVVGAGRDVEPAVTHAKELGRLIAEKGWVLITGGRDAGVMRAANEGAKKAANGLTVGILPERGSEIASDLDIAIITDVGQARNNIIVLSADVVIACGVDGAGTASEISLAIMNGTSVVLLAESEAAKAFFADIGVDQVSNASSPSDAIEIVSSIVGSRPVKATNEHK